MVCTLGEEVIKRVSLLKEFCEKLIDNKGYGVSMAESYFNEKVNPSVKKYKSVVFEYYKKYTTEIKEQPSQHREDHLHKNIKDFLERNIIHMGSD